MFCRLLRFFFVFKLKKKCLKEFLVGEVRSRATDALKRQHFHVPTHTHTHTMSMYNINGFPLSHLFFTFFFFWKIIFVPKGKLVCGRRLRSCARRNMAAAGGRFSRISLFSWSNDAESFSSSSTSLFQFIYFGKFLKCFA